MKIAKYKKLSPRIENFKLAGDGLLKEGYYVGAILYYTIYVEQLLLTAYLYILRIENISLAIETRESIVSKKEQGHFQFGEAINLTLPVIEKSLGAMTALPTVGDDSLRVKCDKLRKIRNFISAHPHFALMLDPTNKWKNAIRDTNYYREVLRKMRIFMEEELSIEPPQVLNVLIKIGHPLTMSTYIEEEFAKVELEVAHDLASYSRRLATTIRNNLKVFIL